VQNAVVRKVVAQGRVSHFQANIRRRMLVVDSKMAIGLIGLAEVDLQEVFFE
jgi:hypothetical protein